MNHQKLKCYALLLDFAKKMPSLLNGLPAGNAYLVDQLKRALSSSILNLAEGNGRWSQRERNRFFDISKASIAEVGAVIDIMSALGYLVPNYSELLKSDLNMIYNMVRKLKK